MSQTLHWEATTEILQKVLKKLMDLNELKSFRLVGGTSLTLQLGHRKSDDIDMFTDLEYGQADFKSIHKLLKSNFDYIGKGTFDDFKIGLMRLVGDSPEDCVKVDFFYTDPFIRPGLSVEGIRMAHVEDIIASKLHIIADCGRKKDFWDIAEILEYYKLGNLLDFAREKYPWIDTEDVLKGLTDFSRADEMEDPICLKGKIWELIKLDIKEIVEGFINSKH